MPTLYHVATVGACIARHIPSIRRSRILNEREVMHFGRWTGHESCNVKGVCGARLRPASDASEAHASGKRNEGATQ
jgi:hypothetical protein